MRCLAKTPADRPATARDLVDTLGALMSPAGAQVISFHPTTPSIAVTRDFLIVVLHTDPSFRLAPPGKGTAIDDDPRWIDLVRRVGLAPLR